MLLDTILLWRKDSSVWSEVVGSSPTVDVLLDARKLLFAGWTTGAFARDAGGNPVRVSSCNAVSFDLVGAIVRSSDNAEASQEAFLVFGECMDVGIPEWQDGATFGEVIGHLDETISTVRSRIFS